MGGAISIREVALPLEGFDALLADARAEHVAFLDRMLGEWESGKMRFQGPGEILLGAFADDQLLGICGLSIDPYIDDITVGRLRHLFVGLAGRGKGVGSLLVNAVLNHARGSFQTVRLRTDPDIRGSFYEDLGFRRIADAQATHAIKLAD